MMNSVPVLQLCGILIMQQKKTHTYNCSLQNDIKEKVGKQMYQVKWSNR